MKNSIALFIGEFGFFGFSFFNSYGFLGYKKQISDLYA